MWEEQEASHSVCGERSFSDLVDVDTFGKLIAMFSRATGYATLLVTFPGREVLIDAGPDVCTRFRRASPQSDTPCWEGCLEHIGDLQEPHALGTCRCVHGLTYGATQIILDGERHATLIVGGVLDESPDDVEGLSGKAEASGFDRDTYSAAAREVPIVAADRFESALAFLSETAALIADLTFSNKKVKGSAALIQRKITEQKQAAAALDRSEELYGNLFHTVLVGLWRTRIADGMFIRINQAAASIVGDVPENLIGKSSVLDFVAAEQRRAELMEQLERDGEVSDFEMPIVLASGVNKDVAIAAKIFPEHGYIEGAITDITRRKQVEEALKNSEEKFRLISEQSLVGIIIIQEGLVVYVNKVAAEINGISREEMLSWTPRDLMGRIHPDDRKQLIDALEVIDARRSEGKIRHFYFRITTGDDRVKWIEQYSKNIKFMGRPAALNTVIDVTRNKEYERELIRLRNLLKSIINSMPSVLVGVDEEGLVNQWNQEAERRTGLPSEDAVGQPMEEAFPRLATEAPQVLEAIRKQEPCHVSRRSRKEGGETLYDDITIYPLVEDGIEGAVIRVDDVTERVRLEGMMVQNEKMLSVGGLAAGMAHEINNPLAGMVQTSALLSSRLTEDLPAGLRAAGEVGTTMETIRAFMERRGIPRMLETIRTSGDRVAKIVADMLSFARKDYAFTSCSLPELLDQTLDLASSDYDLKKKHDFRRIEVIREYEANLPPVTCESGRIQQVLLNLLRNGAESMQRAAEDGAERKQRFTLRLAHEREAGMLRVEIEDSGPGMDEATRKRVFEPFFTTKPTNQGTGLGLSVSYFIITENHGGQMSVESSPGQGAKFVIHLPIHSRVPVTDSTRR